jgi:hypothetical protein
MTLHLYTIAQRLLEEMNILIEQLVVEGCHESVYRDSMKPYICLRKRKSGSGRSVTPMRIEEGITIVPIGQRNFGGTNEREDVGYGFLIACVDGTLSDEIEPGWRIATWEQGIRQRFHQQRIGKLSNNEFCEVACIVVPGELPDWAALGEKIDQTLLQLTCVVRESRR